MLEMTVLLSGVLLSALIGWFVVTRDPTRRTNQLYGLLTFSFIALTVANHFTLQPSEWMLTYIRLVVLFTTIASGTLLLLVLEIYKTSGNKAPAWLAPVAIVSTISVALLELTPAVFTGLTIDSSPTPIAGWGIVPFIFHFLFMICGGVLLLWLGKKYSNVRERKQFKTMLVGMVPILVLAPITSVLLPIFFELTVFILFSPLYLVFFLGSIGYAIVKHGLFDIRMAAVRTLAYVLSLVTLALLYGVLAYVLSQALLGYRSSLEENTINIALALVLAFVFQPVKHFFDVVTDKLFFRNNYDTQQVLDQLGDVVNHNVRITPLFDKTLELLNNSLRPSSLHFVLMESQTTIKRIASRNTEHMLRTPQISALHELNDHVNIIDIMPLENAAVQELLRAHISVVCRLSTKHGMVGYIVLGDKSSGAKYTERDVDLLAVFVDELSVAMENSLRYEEIRAFNRTLQQKVDEATTELKYTNKKLQALDKSKDEFISMASHQLRTPLTAVKGYLSMVLEGDIGDITKEQRQVLEQAYDSSQRMVYLIGDFLNVSRIQTGKFVLELADINLANLIPEEIEQLIDTARSRKIELKYEKADSLPTIRADENKLRQVMMNFMDNAIYYSRPDSVITIQLYKDADSIVFKVIDTGIGVPKSEQPHLFTKFYRATNARQQRPDGTGIGLYMAKKVIVEHGGSVIFETKEGIGSTFGFRLPLKNDLK